MVGGGCRGFWGIGEGWAIGIPAWYQPRGRGGLADGEPRAAEWRDAAAFGCGQRPRGDCGGDFEGGHGQGCEGPGEEGGLESLTHEFLKSLMRSSPIAGPYPLSTRKPRYPDAISGLLSTQPESMPRYKTASPELWPQRRAPTLHNETPENPHTERTKPLIRSSQIGEPNCLDPKTSKFQPWTARP